MCCNLYIRDGNGEKNHESSAETRKMMMKIVWESVSAVKRSYEEYIESIAKYFGCI
jgi:hypothetical protein